MNAYLCRIRMSVHGAKLERQVFGLDIFWRKVARKTSNEYPGNSRLIGLPRRVQCADAAIDIIASTRMHKAAIFGAIRSIEPARRREKL